jgi:hypothetical protein
MIEINDGRQKLALVYHSRRLLWTARANCNLQPDPPAAEALLFTLYASLTRCAA